MKPDTINGLFELIGGILTWTNVARIRRDKQVKGMNLYPMLFITGWGFWNLFYYPFLNQTASFLGGCVILSANLTWLIYAYRFHETQPPMEKAGKSWIRTYNDHIIDFTNVDTEQLDIFDIAHALSQLNRFTGHTKIPYSVAEHSVRCATLVWEGLTQRGVSELTRASIALEALLHDAEEAYVNDLNRPLKYQPGMEAYRDVAHGLKAEIMKKFAPGCCGWVKSPEVLTADNRLYVTESRDLMNYVSTMSDTFPPLLLTIVPWPAKEAESKFLDLFEAYHKIIQRCEEPAHPFYVS